MVRIAGSSLEAIRQRVDIAELVREYIPGLKRAGRNLKACCPFHREKTPSFMVNPERQIFHCFGCQEGGDAFSFVMKMENLGFSEAVEKLARRAGVPVAPAAESLSQREKEVLKIRESLAFARDFYRRILEESPQAGAARRYLDGRGLTPAAREGFGLGFAVADGSSFLEAALRKGFPPDLLAKAGLAALPEGRGRYRDYFRGRILYPIRSAKGDVVGFGARAMGDAMPKYLNSPDTPVFAKGRVLYGLFEGLPEIRKARRAVLMEGYMDVIAAHQFGFKTACAPLGTAVTAAAGDPMGGHTGLIKRYADEVVLVFDPDAAGAAAAFRGAETLLEAGLKVRIATVPGGLDPDEFLHKHGAGKFDECLSRSSDIAEFKTALEFASCPGALDPDAKSRISDGVLATIAKAADEVLKSEWVRRLAERLQTDEGSLRRKLVRIEREAMSRPRGRAPIAPEAKAKPEALPQAEIDMLRAVLRRPELALDESLIVEDDFAHAATKRIFGRIREDGQAGSAALLDALSPEDAALAGALLVEDWGEENPEAVLRKQVEGRRLILRYRELDPEFQAMRQGKRPADPKIDQEYQRLLKRLSDLRLLDLKEP